MGKVLMMVEKDGAIEEQPIRIGKMKVRQLKKALKKIQEVINLVQGDESASELISYFMDMDNEPKAEGEETPAIGLNDLEDKIFLENMLGAFKILFNKIPDEITELISIISGVDEELIEEQDYDVLFDIVIAIVDENDIRSMVDRAKNTFFTMKNKWGGLKAIKG